MGPAVITALSPERLAQLHAQGRERSRQSQFINPYTIAKCDRVLKTRGEDWAQSVLMRKFTRRSLVDSRWPWLELGEDEILVLADQAEWQALGEWVNSDN